MTEVPLSHPWSRKEDGKSTKGAGRVQSQLTGTEMLLEVSMGHFCLVTGSCLVVRKAGKCHLYSRWSDIHSEPRSATEDPQSPGRKRSTSAPTGLPLPGQMPPALQIFRSQTHIIVYLVFKYS